MKKHSFLSLRSRLTRPSSLARVALAIFCSCIIAKGQLTSIDARSLKGRIDPRNTQPILVEIKPDGSYRYEAKELLRDELARKLDALMDTRSPENRRITVAAQPIMRFDRIVELMLIGRALEVDDFTLVTPTNSNEGVSTAGVDVKIVLEEPGDKRPEPWPQSLIVEGSLNGSLLLNGKAHTEESLVASLKRIFETRKKRRIYIEGSRDVEKTVFVRSAKSATYADLIEVLRIVHSSGARPIAVEIDWLK